MKRWLRIVAVNLALLCAGLGILELAFGGWLNSSRLNRLNLLRNCVLHYDASHLYDDPNPIITYSRDRYGLRGTHVSPAQIDILTVGGSTTDQRYVRDGETWQDVLQQEFERTGVAAVVANAGVDGQSTFGHIKNFQWWFPHIPGLAPKYILFYVGLNDFHKDPGCSYDERVVGKQGLAVMRSIRENSVLWNLMRTLHGAWEAMVVKKISRRAVDFQSVRWSRQALQSDYSFMQPRLGAYADRLRILADLTRELGAKPIFVSQPCRQYRITPGGVEGQSRVTSYDHRKINGLDCYHMLKLMDRVLATVAHEKGAMFVDLASQGQWDTSDFYDFTHMTPHGAVKVGKLLHQALRGLIAADEAANRRKGE